MSLERRTIAGGLRTQLLLGISLMLVGTFALVLITVENAIARELRRSALHEVEMVAVITAAAVDAGASPRSLLGSGVVGIESAQACVGARCDILADAPQRGLTQSDGILFGSAEHDGVRVLLELPEVERRRRDARGFLWPFFLVDAIFVLALGYAFFTFLVLRPLRAIGVAANRAAEGDFASSISLLPRNEFGDVGRSFNRMLERIDEGRASLEAQIAEVESANARLARTQTSLIRSEKLASVGHLSAGIAHEVGNPLAAISGYVDLLGDESLDEDEQSEVIERISLQIDRIQGIIRNLLDYSRSDEGLVPVPVDLSDVVDDALALVKAIPRAVHVDFEVVGNARALAVKPQLVQVLVNLFVNAVDAYEGSSGEVVIELEQSEEHATVSVRDEASGIAPELLARIFDPFYTTKDVGEGTGLGLSISHRLIADLDGRLEVTSELGRGTTFTIVLPTSAGAQR